MNNEELSKEVLNSDLSDDAKIAVMKVIFGVKEDQYVPPYGVGKDNMLYPNITWPQFVPVDKNDWWTQLPTVTCENADALWWKQHLENGRADCVTSNPVTYSCGTI